MNNLSLGQRQLLAVALLVLVLLALFLLLIKPVVTQYLDYGESIEGLDSQLAHYQRLAAGAEDAERELQALQAENPTTELYLPESKPALAAAKLQQHLHRVVGRSGGQVISTQILTQKRQEPIPSVVVKVHLREETEQLVDLLYHLETGKPMLFMENLVVTSNPRRQARRTRKARRNQQNQNRSRVVRTQPPSLDVRFDLIGYTGKEAL
jgi:general secretion pathway protein M